MPLAHDNRIDGAGLKGCAVLVPAVLRLALDRRPLDVVPQIAAPKIQQEEEERIQRGPFVQAVHVIGQWRVVWLPRYV
jgi:hypothetical protein